MARDYRAGHFLGDFGDRGSGRSTLDVIKRRGVLVCGVNGSLQGFSLLNAVKEREGLDIDRRAGKADKVKFVALTPGSALRSGDHVHVVGDVRGLMVYPMGGTIDGTRGGHVLRAPPFIVTASQVDEIVDRLGSAVDDALA